MSTTANDPSESTRDRETRRIGESHATLEEQMAALRALDLIGEISDEEWEIMHAGTCGLCGNPGRLYPSGWRCDGCATSEQARR